jgi:hypothetical protein
MRTTVWSIVGCAALCAALNCNAEVKVEEQEVGPVGQPQDVKYVVNPHGGHLATVAHKGSRVAVIYDGVAGPKFDEIVAPIVSYIDPRPYQNVDINLIPRNLPVTFSRDGKRFAYVARQGQEWVVMADAKEMLRIPAATGQDIRLEFSGDDGKHLFFAKSGFAGYELWVDGQKMPGYYGSGGGGTEGTIDPLITRDGAHFAYVASMGTHPGDKRTVIVDGKDAGYLGDNLAYTADGTHLFAIVRQGAVVWLAVDGKPKIKTDGITQIIMAPSGNGFAAVLQRLQPPGQFLIVNGKKVEGSDCQSIDKVVISPDGKHFATVCTASPQIKFVLADGKKGQEYFSIDSYLESLSTGLQFSADSSKVGYVANSNGKKFIVINDDESDAFENVAGFMFSPDGKHVVMSGMQNTRSPQSPGGVTQSWPVFIDGKAERLWRGGNLDTFTFSPDMTRHAYFAGASTWMGNGTGPVFLDGKETGIDGNFTFSPDSKHIVIAGYRAAENKRGLFLDGKQVYSNERNVNYRAFTPDGQHLFWMALEEAKSKEPGAFESVTYLDGKPVARCDRIDSGAVVQIYSASSSSAFMKTPPAWNVGSDGVLTMLAPVGDVIKRYRVTPSSDTSITTMLAGTAK